MKQESVLKKIRLMTILFGLGYLAFSIALIARPDRFASLLGFVLGAAAILFGVWKIVVYFVKEMKESVFAGSLFMGVSLAIIGLLILIKYRSVPGYLYFVYFAMLIAGSMIKVQNALDLRIMKYEKWWIVLILGFVSAAMAIFLVLRPGIISAHYSLISAILIMYDAIADFASVILFQLRYRKIKKAEQTGTPIPTPEPHAPKAEKAPKPEKKEKKHHGFFKKKDGEAAGSSGTADPFDPAGGAAAAGSAEPQSAVNHENAPAGSTGNTKAAASDQNSEIRRAQAEGADSGIFEKAEKEDLPVADAQFEQIEEPEAPFAASAAGTVNVQKEADEEPVDVSPAPWDLSQKDAKPKFDPETGEPLN